VSRQPDFSTAPRPSPRRTWERIALALGVLAVAGVGLAAQRARGEAASAVARLAQTQAEVDRLTAQRSALAARRAAGVGAGADAASSPARVVAAIAAALPPDARLERLAIDYSRGIAIEMQVVTRSPSAWDRLLEALERSPQFREVAPGPESRAGEVRSVVHARWTGGAR